MTATINLEARVVVCPCTGENFKVSLSNGMDGKTMSLTLKCAKCGRSYTMRKGMKELEHDHQ